MLIIDQSAVPAAVDMGLLEEVRLDNKRKISGASIRAFQSKYMAIKELAIELKTSSPRLTRLANTAVIPIVWLDYNTRPSKLPLIQRTDGNRLTDLFIQERKSRDVRAAVWAAQVSGETRSNRLRAYFEQLAATGASLPRRSGMPAKAIIERLCSLPKGTFDRYAELSKMLKEQDRRERQIDKALGMSSKERVQRYVAAIKKGGVDVPKHKGRPRLDMIAQACGVGKHVFQNSPELKLLVYRLA